MKKELNEQKTQREYYFDNLKFILILLVVIAHVISPLGKLDVVRYIYRYIYIFHMPCFIFVSGYFAKKSISSGTLKNNKVLNYMLLYIIFQIIFTIINSGKYSFYQSQMGLWYIQCLIIWTMALPMIDRIKPVYGIIIAVMAGLIIGFDATAGHVASLSRLLVFMPFFVAGYYIKKEHIEKLFTYKNKILAFLFMIIFSIVLYKYYPSIPSLLNLVSGKASYEAMKLGYSGVLYRLGWYVAAGLISTALLVLIPKKKYFFSKVGEKTLQIFCLHLIICVLMRQSGVYEHLNSNTGFSILIVFCIVITFILSSKIVSYPFNAIMKMKFKHILKKEDSTKKSNTF